MISKSNYIANTQMNEFKKSLKNMELVTTKNKEKPIISSKSSAKKSLQVTPKSKKNNPFGVPIGVHGTKAVPSKKSSNNGPNTQGNLGKVSKGAKLSNRKNPFIRQQSQGAQSPNGMKSTGVASVGPKNKQRSSPMRVEQRSQATRSPNGIKVTGASSRISKNRQAGPANGNKEPQSRRNKAVEPSPLKQSGGSKRQPNNKGRVGRAQVSKGVSNLGTQPIYGVVNANVSVGRRPATKSPGEVSQGTLPRASGNVEPSIKPAMLLKTPLTQIGESKPGFKYISSNEINTRMKQIMKNKNISKAKLLVCKKKKCRKIK
tara:strand:+ start:375 stop:1325 length:951 start_codon:yes stop_codon:yes gene_type:complete